VGVVGVTVIVLPDAPVDQRYVDPPLAINVAVCPAQIVGEFTLTFGKEFTVTTATADPVQPPVLPVTV
jgi:hypothetical protein